MPRAMKLQLEWLDNGSGLTVYLPESEHHPTSSTYSAGPIAKIADTPAQCRALRNPRDRSAWIELLIVWAYQITEGLVE